VNLSLETARDAELAEDCEQRGREKNPHDTRRG
jgi:hypothetical protein